jgi:hypothetical protein
MVANSPFVFCDSSQRHRVVPLSSGTWPKQNSIGDVGFGLTFIRISADCADCPAGRDRRHDVDAETSRARSCRRGEAYSTGPRHLQAVFYDSRCKIWQGDRYNPIDRPAAQMFAAILRIAVFRIFTYVPRGAGIGA